jgi:ribosomal protein S12 methylthiotransferase
MADSRQITGMLGQTGYRFVDKAESADILMVNTCGFVDSAKEESINAILDLAGHKAAGHGKNLVVIGCLVQKYGRELADALPEVDLFIGTGDMPDLSYRLSRLNSGGRGLYAGPPERYLFEDRWVSVPKSGHFEYVKIAEGCDHHCTYCAIPAMRGRYRSRPRASILREAEALAAGGCRELILVAQDTSLYGVDLGQSQGLCDLIEDLEQISDLEWIRLLYHYPEGIHERLLDMMARRRKLCAYLDLPFQHISDGILKKMGRPLRSQDIRRLIGRIREIIPQVTLRSAFIVGFPGETETRFQELLDFLKEAQLDRAGFFVFSPQPGTAAAALPDPVDDSVKEERLFRAEALQNGILKAKQNRRVGQNIEVMVDRASPEQEMWWEGRTCGDAPDIDGVVYFLSEKTHEPGTVRSVHITHSQGYSLIGELVE